MRGFVGGLLLSVFVTLVVAGFGAVWAQASNEPAAPQNSVIEVDPPAGYGAPPTFRTADPIGSIPEMEEFRGKEVSEVFT